MPPKQGIAAASPFNHPSALSPYGAGGIGGGGYSAASSSAAAYTSSSSSSSSSFGASRGMPSHPLQFSSAGTGAGAGAGGHLAVGVTRETASMLAAARAAAAWVPASFAVVLNPPPSAAPAGGAKPGSTLALREARARLLKQLAGCGRDLIILGPGPNPEDPADKWTERGTGIA